MAGNKQLLVAVIALSILQGHSASPLVKRQAPTEISVDDLSGLVSGVINTGLRSLTTLVTNGGEATRKLASDVGASALPPLLGVSKSVKNIRKSGVPLLNEARIRPILIDPAPLTARIVLNVAPALRDFNKAVEEQNGIFGGRRPTGSRPLGGGLLLGLLGVGGNGQGRNPSTSEEPPKIDLSQVPEPSFDDIPENVF